MGKYSKPPQYFKNFSGKQNDKSKPLSTRFPRLFGHSRGFKDCQSFVTSYVQTKPGRMIWSVVCGMRHLKRKNHFDEETSHGCELQTCLSTQKLLKQIKKHKASCHNDSMKTCQPCQMWEKVKKLYVLTDFMFTHQDPNKHSPTFEPNNSDPNLSQEERQPFSDITSNDEGSRDRLKMMLRSPITISEVFSDTEDFQENDGQISDEENDESKDQEI